ncbi:MAG: phosphoglycerate kinase [Flavobacteriales bacterium]|nr:phosphoglycerate kinase [Flavobacteriales bacterium]|tara:strand:- start:2539 stop:3726 length:1188 start_codon:yes stop_codon:yes gene_type:complete
MKNILDQSFEGKRVIVRVDFNVPLDEKFNITDGSRINAALPTINKLLNDKARVILMSHLGRPKGKEERYSLRHLVNYLQKLLGVLVSFSDDCIGSSAKKAVSKLNNGEVLVLENLRFYKQEKLGEERFARQLSDLADVYVNDAFGAAHRNHASTSTIASFFPSEKYFGLLLKKEVDSLEKALNNPEKPFTAIIGGAKVSGKIEVIKSLLEKVDCLIIGGGMAYTFVRAIGGKIGSSLLEEDKIDLAKSIIKKSKELGVKLLLPVDSVNANDFNSDADIKKSDILDIQDSYMGLDIGEKSINIFSKEIENSKTIIWNGPMGVFEMSNFENGTKKIGEAICKSTVNGAFSLVGGGDSVAAVKKFNLEDQVSYISTGGGAMLEYLEGKELPGVRAILK